MEENRENMAEAENGQVTEDKVQPDSEQAAEETVQAASEQAAEEAPAPESEQTTEENATAESEQTAKEAPASEGEQAAEGSPAPEGEQAGDGASGEDGENGENEGEEAAGASKDDLIKKIKIGIVAAGGVFILLAAVYAASLVGGKNTAIDKDDPVIAAAIPTDEPEKVTYAPITPTATVVEEEPPEESILCIAQGNARYDECIYADGGTCIVKKGDSYGAIDYEGKEIVAPKYDEIEELPTKEGMFVLSVSKSQSVTKEQDGTTYSYEDVTTTYTLFDNTGKKLYEGNDAVLASGNVYMLAKEDDSDTRKNRVEYYKLSDTKKAFLVLYVNDQFSMNGFRDGMTAVMGFTAVPTEDQDTNPTNLFCGTMNESGKVSWFAKAPGMDKFDAEVAQWKEDNKIIRQTSTKKKKTSAKKKKEKKYDEDGNEITEDTDDENEDDELIDEEEEDEELEEEDEELEEDTEDEELEEESDDTDELDMSAGPVYHMNEILNAPNGGFFVYKDLFDVEDSYSWYTDKGVWYADLDTAFMKADPKKGFVLGNFNNGAVEARSYIYDGETYYNCGEHMVLTVGDRDVLIDIKKGQGMTDESLTDKIVVAVYDEIRISGEDYWMYRDGNKYGYIDRKGKTAGETYEDATDFVDGYAIVIKSGKAYIIDDSFKELEEIGEASDVEKIGDIFCVSADDGERRYILKSVRENPTGAKADSKTSSGAEKDKK